MILLLATFQSQVPQVNFWYIYHPVLCQSAVSFTSTGWCFNRLQCKHYRWSERFSPAQKGHLPPQQIFPNIRLDFFFFKKFGSCIEVWGWGVFHCIYMCVESVFISKIHSCILYPYVRNVIHATLACWDACGHNLIRMLPPTSWKTFISHNFFQNF